MAAQWLKECFDSSQYNFQRDKPDGFFTSLFSFLTVFMDWMRSVQGLGKYFEVRLKTPHWVGSGLFLLWKSKLPVRFGQLNVSSCLNSGKWNKWVRIYPFIYGEQNPY